MKIMIIKKCGSENDLYLLYDDNDFINMAKVINNPDASIGAQCSTFRTVCSHKVAAVGVNTFCYNA